MARTANFMLNFGANVTNLVANARVATRSLASMEYVAGRTSKKMGALSPLFESAGYLSGMALITGAGSALTARTIHEKIIYPAISAAIELDAELRELYYLAGTNAGSQFAEGIKQRMQDQAIKSVLDFPSVVKGMSEIIKGGISQGDAMEMADSLTNLVEASFGKMNVDAAGQMIAMLNLKFRRPDNQSVKAWSDYLTDMSVMAAQNTHLDLQDIFSMMGALSAAPQISSQTSPQEMFAMLQMLAQAGKRARMSGMQLNSFVNDMLNATNTLGDEFGAEKRKEAMGLLGIDYESLFGTGSDGQKVLKSVPQFLGELLDARDRSIAENGVDGERLWAGRVDKMMGTNISTMMVQLAKSAEVIGADGIKYVGKAALQELTKMYENSRGMTEKAAKAYRETWRGQIEIAAGAWKTFFALMGEDMLKQLGQVMSMTTGLIQDLVKFVNKYPIAIRMITLAVGAAMLASVVIAALSSGLAMIMLTTIFIIPGLVQMVGAFTGSLIKIGSMARKMKDMKILSKDLVDAEREKKQLLVEELKVQKEMLRVQHISNKLSEEERQAAAMNKAMGMLDLRNQIAAATAAVGNVGAGGLVLSAAALPAFYIGLGLAATAALVAIAAVAVGIGLVIVGIISIGRLLYKGGKDGIIGAFDTIVAKGKAVLDFLLGLYTYMSEGKWDEDLNERLLGSGGMAYLDFAVKMWDRLKAIWLGITSAVDWTAFDEALSAITAGIAEIFGGPMDTKMNDTKVQWVAFGITLGGIVNVVLQLAVLFIYTLGVILKVASAIGSFVGSGLAWFAETLGLATDNISLLRYGVIALAGAFAILLGGMLLVSTVAAIWLGLLALNLFVLIAVILLVAAAFALIMYMPIILVGLLAYAVYQAGKFVYENWEIIIEKMKSLFMGYIEFVKSNWELILAGPKALVTFLQERNPASPNYDPNAKWINPAIPKPVDDGPGSELWRRREAVHGPGMGWMRTPPPVSPTAAGGQVPNQNINVTANINVPPGTPPESVGKEIGKELGQQIYNKQDYRGARPYFE